MIRCIHCGLPEHEHHAFEPPQVIDGCQCDPRTWGGYPGDIPPPCHKYVRGVEGYCKTCEHDEACHERGEA